MHDFNISAATPMWKIFCSELCELPELCQLPELCELAELRELGLYFRSRNEQLQFLQPSRFMKSQLQQDDCNCSKTITICIKTIAI